MGGPEVVIDAGRKRISVRDLAAPLDICSQTEKYLCFSSEFLSFAVPRNLSEKSTAWNYGGTDYNVLEYRDELILGQELSLYFIGTSIEGRDLVFYFSKERGLFALGGADRVATIFSVGYCGFGAEINCGPALP